MGGGRELDMRQKDEAIESTNASEVRKFGTEKTRDVSDCEPALQRIYVYSDQADRLSLAT